MFKNLLLNIRQSYWVKSGTIVVATRVTLMVLGFIGFLFLIRFLDKEQYGIWVIYITISGLIESVRIGFIKNPLMVLNADSELNKRSLYNSSFVLNISLTIFISVILLIIGSVIRGYYGFHLISLLFYFYVIKLIIISIGDHLDIVQEANFEFKGTFLDLFCRSFVFVVCIIFCFVFKVKIQLYYLVIFQILGAILGSVLSFWNSSQKQINVLPSLKHRFSYLRDLLSLGKFTLGSSASSIAIRNIDTWMIGVILHPSAIAIYNTAIRVSNIFEIPSSAMTTILMPKLSKEIKTTGHDSIKYYYEKSVSHVLIFMIPIVAVGIVFSEEIILIVAGKSFAESGYLLKFTMLYGILVPFIRQFSITLDALGRAKFNFVVVLITLLLSLLLNLLFVTQFGIIGAVYATLITLFIVFIFVQVYMSRKFNVSLIDIFIAIIRGYYVLFRKAKELIKR